MLLQADGVQVIDTLMAHMPCQTSLTLLSSSTEHVGLWAAGEDVWVSALGVLSQVAKYSAIGSQIILEVSTAASLPLLQSAAQCLHRILFGLYVWLTLWAVGCTTCNNNLLRAAPAVGFLPATVDSLLLGVLMQWLRTQRIPLVYGTFRGLLSIAFSSYATAVLTPPMTVS